MEGFNLGKFLLNDKYVDYFYIFVKPFIEILDFHVVIF